MSLVLLLDITESGSITYLSNILVNSHLHSVRLNSPSSLRFSSNTRCTNSLTTFMALHYTHFSMSKSFLCWGAQNWTQALQTFLTIDERSKRITSLDLLAMLLFMKHRMLVCPYLQQGTSLAHIQLYPSVPLRPFCQAASQLAGLQPVLLLGLIHSQVQNLAPLCVEVMDVSVCPVLHHIEVPLNSSTLIWCINHSFPFCLQTGWKCTVSHHLGH